MRRDDIIARLKQAEPTLRARGVGALYLFGSVARDEAHSGSDVDVFVDPDSDERFGFLAYMDAYETIQKAIGGNAAVGYSTRRAVALHPCQRRARRHPDFLMAASKSMIPKSGNRFSDKIMLK